MSTRRREAVDGLDISYFDLGAPDAGETVLLLHGWGFSAGPYLPLARMLAESGRRVLVPDLPGFGHSSSPGRAWGYEQHAAAMATFATTLVGEGARVVAVGHSLGGGVALALAAARPDLVGRLVLVDSAGIPLPVSGARLVVRKLTETLLQLLTPSGFVPTLRMTGAFVENLVRHPRAMLDSFAMVERGDLRGEVARVRAPVRLLWAEGDMTIAIKCGRELAGLLGVELELAPPGVLHDWCLTHPRDLAERLA